MKLAKYLERALLRLLYCMCLSLKTRLESGKVPCTYKIIMQECQTTLSERKEQHLAQSI